MTREDLMRAFEDVVSLVGEHGDVSGAMERMDLDVDAVMSMQSKAAIWLDDNFAGTAHYPPQTRLDRQTALSMAYGFGVLTALKLKDNEEQAQPTRGEPNG